MPLQPSRGATRGAHDRRHARNRCAPNLRRVESMPFRPAATTTASSCAVRRSWPSSSGAACAAEICEVSLTCSEGAGDSERRQLGRGPDGMHAPRSGCGRGGGARLERVRDDRGHRARAGHRERNRRSDGDHADGGLRSRASQVRMLPGAPLDSVYEPCRPAVPRCGSRGALYKERAVRVGCTRVLGFGGAAAALQTVSNGVPSERAPAWRIDGELIPLDPPLEGSARPSPEREPREESVGAPAAASAAAIAPEVRCDATGERWPAARASSRCATRE